MTLKYKHPVLLVDDEVSITNALKRLFRKEPYHVLTASSGKEGLEVLKKAEKSKESGRNEVIKIWSRRSTILPQFVGLTFGVYNGRKHIPVNVSEDMIGQKFGEYSPTRTYYGHSADKKAKRK